MFQIKDHRSIVGSMINLARASQSQITDFSVGSVARTLMESPAIEIEELYLQMLLGLQDAIPVSIYQAFDFPVNSDESELERKTRFIQFVQSLARGTVQSIKYAAALATVKDAGGVVQEYVTGVGAVEFVGMVNLYLRGSAGNASAALVAAAQSRVENYRPAGVEVRVVATTSRAVSFGVSLLFDAGVVPEPSHATKIHAAIAYSISLVSPGGTLTADALVTGIISVAGVLAASLTIDSNIVCGQSEYLIPGTITLSGF